MYLREGAVVEAAYAHERQLDERPRKHEVIRARHEASRDDEDSQLREVRDQLRRSRHRRPAAQLQAMHTSAQCAALNQSFPFELLPCLAAGCANTRARHL
jgi:hypothetical protein